MNSLQRLQNLFSGKPIDRIPNFDIFMARAVRHIGVPLSKYYLDHRVLCEANLAVLKDFDLDIVQTISDPYREAADAGLDVEFPKDNLPLSKTPLITEMDMLSKVNFPVKNFGARMTDRLEGIRWLKELLEKCVEVAIAFASAQIDAGAHIIGLGDAVASQISPRMYREFALSYEQRIFEAIKAKGGIPRLHICGKTTHLLKDMAQSGAQIIDADWMVDLHQAAEAFDGLAVCGNLDPVSIFLQGDTERVRQGIFANAAAGGPRWISAGGCEIPEDTPAENIHAQNEALRELAGQVL